MRRKLLNVGAAVLILAAGLIMAKILSKRKAPQTVKKGENGQKALNFTKITLQELPVFIETGGTLRALDKIEVYAEVGGILHQAGKPFRAGVFFKKNEVLLRIDDRVYRNNVLAQKSGFLNQLTRFLPDFTIDFPKSAQIWQEYLNQFDLNRKMFPLPRAQNDKEQYFIASRNIYNLYYTVKSMEETLDKYTIYAPFDGIVTEYGLNPGTLVRPGQKLGEFMRSDVFELEVPVHIADLPFIQKGDHVTLTSDDIGGKFNGELSRINRKIDPASQTIRVYIAVKDNRLRDGMYLNARITSGRHYRGFKIPSAWLIGKDRLYIKKDSVLVLTGVNVIRNENDFVLVSGLPEGTQILAQEFTGRAQTIRLN